MKYLYLLILFFFSSLLTAQDSKRLNRIEKLKAEIALSENGKKLQYMDSLVRTVNYTPSLKFDSIVKATIAFALQIDSVGIAANRTADLIYYNNTIVNKPEEGLAIFIQFLDKNLPVKNSYSLARLYLNGADSYFFNKQQNKAIEIYEIAEKYAIKAKEDRLLGFVNLYIGETRESLGMFVEASQNYNTAYNYFVKVKDTFNIISSKNSLSRLYSKNGFYKEAKSVRDDAILLLEITKNYEQLANSYYNASVVYSELGNQNKRIDNLLKALEFNNKSTMDLSGPAILSTLAIAYAKNNNTQLSKKYLKEAEKDSEAITKGKNEELYKEALMTIALVDKDFKKAIILGNDLLSMKIKRKDPSEIVRLEKLVAEIYEKLGDSKNSLIHLKNHLSLNDSIKSSQKVKNLIYYQTLYETDKRDFKIIEQGENIEVLNAKNKVKNQWIIFTSIGLIGVFAFILLIRSRNTASKRQKLQQKFSQDLIQIKEDESIRLARELHDSVGQKMMLLSKKIKLHNLDEISILANSTLEELRSISKNLHPSIIEQLGITSAITTLINEVDKHTNLFFTNDINGIDGALDKESNLHVYRILQETLNNIVKHAEATTVFVTIEKNANTIKMVVKDNGKGFEPLKAKVESKSLGMKTILERSIIINSKLSIDSNLGKGTTVKLVIPIK